MYIYVECVWYLFDKKFIIRMEENKIKKNLAINYYSSHDDIDSNSISNNYIYI